MIKKILKESKGITLIALVVTIVVLLILSGIAINLTIGRNGIFSRANEAVIANENVEVYEQLQLKILDYQLTNLNIDEYAILERLAKDGYIDDSGILNVNLLMRKDMKTGNGNPEDGDLYLIFENPDEEDTFNLIYYDSNQEFKDLGKILTAFDLEDYSTPTPEEYFEFDEATGAIALKDADSYYHSNAERYLGLKALVIPSTYNGKEVKQIGIRYYENDYDRVGHIMGINNLADVNTIVIPSSVEILNELSFAGCISVKNIIIPDSVTTIGRSAFSGCSGLTNITIPNSIKSIEEGIFQGCSQLTDITIPNSVTSIGNSAFSSCSGLSNITIPDSVTNIGSYAFSGCSGLKNITISNSVTSIEEGIFQGCSQLTDITIPNSVTSIGYSAFSSCSGLSNITIPDSVTSIKPYAFSGCEGLTSINVDENNQTYDSRDNCNAIIDTNKNELVVGCRDTIIPQDISSIGEGAFYGCTGLTNITIPDSVTSIGTSAFYGCTGLTNVIIPTSVTSIKNSAFARCTGLTDITIPNSVTNMETSVFYGWTSLATIHVPFNKGEKPKGWSSSWSYQCHATIIYSNGEKEQL